MIALTEVPVRDDLLLTPKKQQQPQLVLSGLNVLLIEHRDEVFARLQRDLYQLGIGTYRATALEEVFRVHFRIQIGLTIANSGLAQSSIWLTAAKLRLHNCQARIWTYLANPNRQERVWAELGGIEKVIAYDGSLFQLTDRIQHVLCECRSLNEAATCAFREAS